MKRIRAFLRSPVTTGVLFVLAAALLITSSVGGARAALQYTSQYYTTQVRMYDIGVSLMEKSNRNESREPVSYRNFDRDDLEFKSEHGVLVKNLLPAGSESVWHINDIGPRTVATDKPFQIGKTYQEELSVKNSGSIDQYVRVTVYKYWVNVNPDGTAGAKRTDLDPGLIDLHFVTGNGWTIDESASTRERTVLYYSEMLGGSKADNQVLEQEGTEGAQTQTGKYQSVDTEFHSPDSTPFTDTLTIKEGVMDAGTTVSFASEPDPDGIHYRSYTTSYAYDSVAFQIEVQVDAVQTHSADAARISAWGQFK